MFVAAMLDTFPDLTERVMADAAAVLPKEVGTVSLVPSSKGGISGKRFSVDISGSGYGCGNYAAMMTTIAAAGLKDGAGVHAQAILTILAEAEAGIHSVPVEAVHFHELADWDSLVDIICAGSIAAALDGATWTVSALPRGGGLVSTAHGKLPVPAPATVVILEGFAWRDDGVGGERVTPTGAAILRHLADPTSTRAEGRLIASGTGTGTRDLQGIPNVLRVLAFEPVHAASAERVSVIEFEVDDMTGEEIGLSAERLRNAEGVLDVTLSQRFGKKGRPVHSFRLLVAPHMREAVTARCFAETSTIGLRFRDEDRAILKREAAVSDGMRIKIADRSGQRTAKVESDDLRPGETLQERRAMRDRAERSDG
ncbi:MAG: LarC family nickel insertion protein [Brucellaceae bacterium]|nr:LarC family nickel insertion protein [Brucellaceae bacterium]